MIKIVTPSAFDFDQPIMSLVDVHSNGIDKSWLRKSAAVMTKEMSELKPEKGTTFVHLIALGDSETYGCFFEGTPVQTISGLKPIETIQEGELVLTHKGRYRKVLRTFEAEYTGERVSIRAIGMPVPTVSTDEQPIQVVRASACTPRLRFSRRRDGVFNEYIDGLVDEAEWVAAKDVSCGDFLIIPCGSDDSVSDSRPSDFDPYVVGLYTAEGCLYKEYKDISTKGEYTGIVLTVSDKDEDAIEYTQNWLESVGRDRVTVQQSYTSEYGRRITFGFKEFAQWLDNTFGHMAITKRIHPSIFSWSEEDKLKFIAGYLDGDGCITDNPSYERYVGTVRASTASLNLALDFQRLLGSLGVGASVNKSTNKISDGCFGHEDTDIYECSIGSTVSDYVIQHCLRLKQHGKQFKCTAGSSVQASGRYMLVPVKSVTKEATDPTVKYNLEVDEDNSYVVYTSVHNSNRNGDLFPRSANESCHHTFVKHAKWYHNHKNKPHLGHPSFGYVKTSAYNPEMHRVELIIGIDEKKDPDSIQKIASGEDLPVSMACITNPEYPVLTDSGYKPIAQVTTADKVLTHNSKWQQVKALNRRPYTGNLLTFEMNGLPFPLELTEDHMMFSKVFEGSKAIAAVQSKAKRYFKDPEAFNNEPAGWAHASHIEVGDRFFYQPVPSNEAYGVLADITLARLLGYYVAEGSLAYNAERACSVHFTVNMDDMAVREIPAAIQDLNIGSSCLIKPKRNCEAALDLGVHSTGLAELINRMSGVGCRGKQVPYEVFNADVDVKLAYLGAWHEGDGFADKKGVHWSTASVELALSCRDLLASINIPSSIYKIDHSKCATSGYSGSGIEHTINVSWLDASPLTKWSHKVADSSYSITETAAGNRRKPAAMRPCIDGRYAYRIKNVTSRHAADVQTYNIEVEEDESYLLAGMISHNCKVPFDECTICHNKAKTANDYCDHIKEAVTQFTDDGRQIGMINHEPNFFDISKVHRNADRIAFTLRKVAGVNNVVLGAELAEEYGLTEPVELIKDAKLLSRIDLLQKLAEMEKEIDGEIKGDANMQNIASSIQDAPCDVGTVPQNEMGGMMRELADAKVSLPLNSFFKMAMGSRFSEIEDDIPSARSALPGVFKEASCDPVRFLSGISNYESVDKGIPHLLKRVVEKVARTSSLDAGPIGGRVQLTVLRKSASVQLRTNVTPAGKCLAEEYARYKFAFIERVQDPFVVKMALIQNFG